MYIEALSHVVAVAEVERLQHDSFTISKTSPTTGVMGRVNQAKMVWCLAPYEQTGIVFNLNNNKMVRCLISALVYMSAAIKSLAEFTDDHHPVLCTALEYTAKVLTSQNL